VFVARFNFVTKIANFTNQVNNILAKCPTIPSEKIGHIVALLALQLIGDFFAVVSGLWLGPLGVAITSAVIGRATSSFMKYSLETNFDCKI